MLDKKTFFWIVIKITVLSMINQELIYHIHCFEYTFCHQNKTTKFNRFHKFLFYGLYFEFYSLNVSKNFFPQYIFLILIMNSCCSNIFIHSFCFFMFNIVVYQTEIHIWLQSVKFFNCNTSSFIFLWTTIVFWLSWIITYIMYIFNFNLLQKLNYKCLWIIVLASCHVYFQYNHIGIRALIIYSIQNTYCNVSRFVKF